VGAISVSPTNTPKKLEGLQVLRAIAALLVLWSHLKYNLGVPPETFTGNPWLATSVGAIGVDIFFVISGYVIAMTGSRLESDWRSFMAMRVARIIPLYFTLSTYALVEAAISARLHGDVVRFSWRQIFNTYAFIPLFDGRDFIGPILVPGWTLSFEMWFYICFACLMRYSGGTLAATRLPCILAAAVAAKILFLPSVGWGLLNFLFHPITLEFCAGCLLYHYRNSIGKAVFYGMAVTSLPLLYFAQQTEYLGLHLAVMNNPVLGMYRTVVWGGFAVCLVGVVTQIDLKHQARWPRWLTLLGDASYAIYLMPVIVLMTFNILCHGLGRLTGHDITAMPLLARGILGVTATIVFSVLTWKYFELPAIRVTKNFLLRFFANRSTPNKAGALTTSAGT
jgi:exopolysaccharide production protein ExoZ